MTRPYLHPNGFLQYDLPDGKRLHVWHPDMPQAQKVYTPIHDHTFSFRSKIIAGALFNFEYQIESLPFGFQGDHAMWAAPTTTPDLIFTGHYCDVHQQGIELYTPGMSYNFPACEFHKSEAQIPTATIMEKTATRLAPFPYVLVPSGLAPDNEFRRDQYPASDLMPFVRLFIKELEEEGYELSLA